MAGKTKISSVVFILSLVTLFGLGTAHADVESLIVGSVYTGTIIMNTVAADGTTVFATQPLTGGSMDVSSLDGVTLPFLYCVDIPDNVFVGETYSETVADNSGLVNNSPDQFAAVNTGSLVQLKPQVVDEVAWLLDNYGVGGQGDAAVALQAAIWHVVYTGNTFNGPNGYSFDLAPTSAGNSAAAVSDYNTEISVLNTAIGNNAVASAAPILWLSPAPAQNGLTIEQGLVTAAVPEPTTIVLLCAFLAAGFLGLRAKRKLAQGLSGRQGY